ncbi:small ribosomal subunit protein mS23 [Ostrinia nubilalis]|uniref:small ribosomal subunit protein mS23 n=1 Tax=Ostrinia nubilalis TaxID=29057 RepID=UPI003082574B
MASSRLERIGTILTRVEGLLKNGAMKPDDRPLWYDVYRAFPPAVEPKFARPVPDIKPIRQILYQEDVVRAKFHENGHGLGSVNMLSPSEETHTKRLLKRYEKLKSEGVAEDQLVEKAASEVASERQEFVKAKLTPQNPDSITAQVLTDVKLKDIFNEK